MHCTPSADTQPPRLRPPSLRLPSAAPQANTAPVVGEIPAWESCGRIVGDEREHFFEFMACNVGLALIAVGIVLVRSKQLQAMQARQLAARIGLVRRVPGGWVG